MERHLYFHILPPPPPPIKPLKTWCGTQIILVSTVPIMPVHCFASCYICSLCPLFYESCVTVLTGTIIFWNIKELMNIVANNSNVKVGMPNTATCTLVIPIHTGEFVNCANMGCRTAVLTGDYYILPILGQ